MGVSSASGWARKDHHHNRHYPRHRHSHRRPLTAPRTQLSTPGMAAAAAAAAAISCLLQVILVSSIAATSAGQLHEKQLQVLSEVVFGPARERPLALHLDSSLPEDVQRAALSIEAVRRTPHLTLSFGLNHSLQRARQEVTAAAIPRVLSSSMLHVVLWLTPRPELLQTLWLHWKPRNLLLFSLGSSPDADVLRDEALSGVEKLALIGHLSAETNQDPNALVVYTMLPFSFVGVKLLGLWRRESFGSWKALFPDRFPSFEGYTFHLANKIQDEPFYYQNESDPLKADGVSEEMLQSLSSKLNFTYTATTDSPDSNWGNLSNGSWDGLLGMLERREKNFTINILWNTYDRGKAFDISVSFHTDGFGVFLPRPDPLPLWTSLLRPLQSSVWAGVFVSFLAGIFVTKLQVKIFKVWSSLRLKIYKFHSFLWSCLQEDVVGCRGHRQTRRGTVSVWLQLHRCLVSQSAPVLPQAPWQRLFLSVWLLYCLVVTAAYTCNLVGIFTRPAFPRRLRTLQEFVGSDFRLSVPDSSNLMTATLKNSQDPLYVSLREKMDLYPTMDECLEAMVRGSHAVLENIPYTTLVIGRALKGRGWYMVGQRLVPSAGSWFFPKRTPWKYKFDEGIQQLLDAGLVQYWIQVKNAELTDDGGGDSANPEAGRDGPAPPLSLRHLQGVFYILALAWVASGAILLLELLIHRLKKSRGGLQSTG